MGNYEGEFKGMLRNLRQKGIGGGVFGDIDLEEHRQWVERVCGEVEMTPHLPLWEQAQEKVLRDFIGLGFEAIIVAVKPDTLDEEWLGRKVDLDFLAYLLELQKTNEITLCGEVGEYHTFAIDGPLFNQRIEILEASKVLRDGHWFLDISKSDLRAK